MDSDSITKTKQMYSLIQKNYSHGGSPMNLTITFADYFYSKCYYGRSVALANGMIDEDKGCSLSDRTTFGSVGGGTTLASDPVSTPSAG